MFFIKAKIVHSSFRSCILFIATYICFDRVGSNTAVRLQEQGKAYYNTWHV